VASANQPSSVDVYCGFCALYDVISYIVDSSPSITTCGQDTRLTEVDAEEVSEASNRDGQGIPSQLASVGQHISNIVLPAFRLEVMEDVFSLLFARSEHLRDSEDSPDRQSCDSEPETSNKDVNDTKQQEFEFYAARGKVDRENTPNGSHVARTMHEVTLADVPRVGTLMVESRHSPLEVSSSSVDGRSDELSGSQTVSNSSLQCGDEGGFLARDYVVHNVLLLLHDCSEKLHRELTAKLTSADGRSSNRGEQRAANLQLRQRAEALREHVRDAQWRLRIVSASSSVPMSRSSERHEPKRQRRRSKQYRDGVSFKDSTDYPMKSHYSHTVVSKMLCRPDSLLNMCLTEGKFSEAEEVIKVSRRSQHSQNYKVPSGQCFCDL